MRSSKRLSVRCRRILALLLAVTMVTGMFPASFVQAAEPSGTEEEEISIVPLSEVPAEEASQEAYAETASAEKTAQDETVNADKEADGSGDVRLAQYAFDTEFFETFVKCTVLQYGAAGIPVWDRNYTYIRVLKDGEDIGSLYQLKKAGTILFEKKWQMQSGDVWTDMEAVPSITSSVGNYRLVVRIPAVPGVSEEAVLEMPFEITKAKMTLSFSVDEIKPGTLAEDVRVSEAEVSYEGKETHRYQYTEDETSRLNITLSVKDGYTGEVLPGDTRLKKSGDYRVEATPTFTDLVPAEEQACFILEPAHRKLEIGTLKPEVVVSLTDKWKTESEDGAACAYSAVYTGEDVAAPLEGTDYTVQIRYQDGYDAVTGEPEYVQIHPTAEQISCAWYSEKDLSAKMEENPVDAGTYYYGITYSGEAGFYEASTAYIKVTVEPRELILVPKWKSGEAPVFYPGMSETDILSAVDYDVTDVSGAPVAVDRDHIWGNSASLDGTFSYSPLFKVQAETGAENAYADNSGALLSSGKAYRVIFSGKRVTYHADGAVFSTGSINGKIDPNYVVNVTDSVQAERALPVAVAEGSAAVIDVSALYMEGVGSSYDNPIVKTYDGAGLYPARVEYKKAKVTDAADASRILADNADGKITYTWYKQRLVAVGDSGWEELQYYCSPKDAGTYKLEVTYRDPANVYHASAASVYYVIEKQKIQVVPKSVPAALTETAVDEYDFDAIKYEIRTVVSEGESTILPWTEGEDYDIEWQIEQAAAEDPDNYSKASGNFVQGNSYRVGVYHGAFVSGLSLYNNLSANYVDYENVAERKDGVLVAFQTFLNETCPIALNEMGTTELLIQTDLSKLSCAEKVYDGEAFDLSADIKEGLVTLVKRSDGSAVTDAEPEYRWYDETTGKYVEQAVDSGSYKLYAGFGGNSAYHSAAEVEVASVVITPRDLTLEAVLDEPVVAGTPVGSLYAQSGMKFVGMASCDEKAFVYQFFYDEKLGKYVTGFPAVSVLHVYVKDENNKTMLYSRDLAGEKTYTIVTSCSLRSPYSRNYTVNKKQTVFTTVRGNSSVCEYDMDHMEPTGIVDIIDGMNHVIKPTEPVKYSYDIYNRETDSYVSGNYLGFRIVPPYEYRDSWVVKWKEEAAYREEIEKAGGFIHHVDLYIYVIFDASARDKKEFSICWEEGYTEHYTVDLTQAVLMADLNSAVEPKSIAFNAPAKKMAVGETQALDVKLTKKLKADVISLEYSVDNKDVLCLNERGEVTALKKGKATVTVYPVKYDYSAKRTVPIPGAKTAKVTITVTDVTAPKIRKVSARDLNATVNYGQVKDGYRREIYVLKGKGIKASTFETKIASMTNEHWEGIFAIAPIYLSGEWTIAGNGSYSLKNLEPNREYTVYVRNVSRVRVLNDGCRVAVSAKGSVKSFKTTKSQVKSLYTYFAESEPVYYSVDNDRNEVKLSAGTVRVSVMGQFDETAANAAAEAGDSLEYELPLGSAQKKIFTAPKLTYYVAERTDKSPGKGKYYAYESGSYYVPTALATIDRSGKMKLSGVGQVYVGAADTVTGVVSNWVPVYITAAPDSIAGKKVTLQVGQTMPLVSMVDYKEGKKVLKGTFDRSIVVTDELKKAIADSGYFEMNFEGTAVTALKPGGSLPGLGFTDIYCGADTTVSLKSAALAAVSGLKVAAITDRYADMTFVYNGYGNKFKIEVVDGRGRSIKSETYDRYDLYSSTDDKGNTCYAYRVEGLTKLSAYTVKVTAVYRHTYDSNNVESKTVKKSIKTTRMPASYKSVKENTVNGGIDIYVTHVSKKTLLKNYPGFVSGNVYSLIAAGEGKSLNEGAKVTVSDSLIWTSSNRKVATVKANPGTYTASMKTVKAGYTVIEVKSGITKQVIARYGVSVSAVGDAYSYYGDNEPVQATPIPESPGPSELVTRDFINTRRASYGFMPQSDGRYYFWTTGNSDTYGTLEKVEGNVLATDDDSGEDRNFKIAYDLKAGQKVYIGIRAFNSTDYFSCTLHISRKEP